MKTLAAILVETGRPLELVDLAMPPLKAGQVLVAVTTSGVCHTQVLEARGHRGEDRFLPHCLGHEGVGVVRELGTGVTKVKPGDRVILSWLKGSGADVPGTQYEWGGKKVNAGGVTTFSALTIASENRLTPLPAGVPARQAALLGCAIPTGVGAVFNAAGAKPGSSIAIFGCGGVGLCAVAGAKVAGCGIIVAIDIKAEKLALAQRLGATHVIHGGDHPVLERAREIVPAGLDHSIEATGRPDVMREALQCVRQRGGSAVVIGNARFGETLELDPQQLNQGKRLIGTWGGDCDPDRDFPRFAALMSEGRLDLGPLLEPGGETPCSPERYKLTDINSALADLESGKCVRPMIEVSDD
jgi:S-(hydroxymethyl)glutathione dehydrogenase/alcohol dehydrogenase